MRKLASNVKGETNCELPSYGKRFRSVYTSFPKVNLPFTNVSFSFVTVAAAFLISVRLSSVKIMENFFGWPIDDVVTDRAASSVPAIVHSSILCPGLIAAFLVRKFSPGEHISKSNQAWQDLANGLLEFCTGYMLNDTVFLVYRAMPADSWIPIFTFGDQLLLFHHAMTSIYMTQARYYQAGHMSAMMCMLIGELSNPLHNTYYILDIASKLDCCNGGNVKKILSIVTPLFCAVFLLLRVIVGPIVLSYNAYGVTFSKEGKENLPLWVRLFWSFMIYAVLFGSIPEILSCKEMLEDAFKGTEQEL